MISNFRMLLSGGSFGKLGTLAMAGGNSGDGLGEMLLYFQALSTAIEGTYVTPTDKERTPHPTRPAPKAPAKPGRN